MTRSRKTVPWWGRLEARVIAALVLLGIFSVGASAYLVQSTVAFFDERLGDALEQSGELADAVRPFQADLVDAHIEAYNARGKALALELALAQAQTGMRPDRARLLAMLEREADVVKLRVHRPGTSPLEVNRVAVCSEDDLWFPVRAPISGAASSELEVIFCRDPEIDARFQAIGERNRQIGLDRTQQPALERTVAKVIGLVTGLVLLVSLLVGFLLARATTRRVTELSEVMARVAGGDLDARARWRGHDEIGQLAQAFNGMLDDLSAVQQKVAYLQRIGAWQEMARRLAHEIKNPLTPIQLAVQQLREKDPGISPQFSELLRTSAEIIEDEVEGLRRMVASFSQFAKVPKVHPEPVRVARILEEFERAYGHLTEDEHDRLEVAAVDPKLAVFGDGQLLKQCLVNLVENAALSVREAGVGAAHVRVVARVARDDDATVEIRVEDNGPGIESARRERVFEPYETSRPDGTGLGLAIVKKIVLDHGGQVAVEDSELGGAALVMRLPREVGA